MKYHKQKILHDPDNDQWGDCYKVAIACLLDMEPDDVPHFADGGPTADEFNEKVEGWLNERGFSRIIIGLVCDPDYMMDLMARQNPGVIYLLAGKSPRHSECHVVIAQDDQIIHDPHPDGTGLDGPDVNGGTWIEFLVPQHIHAGVCP